MAKAEFYKENLRAIQYFLRSPEGRVFEFEDLLVATERELGRPTGGPGPQGSIKSYLELLVDNGSLRRQATVYFR